MATKTKKRTAKNPTHTEDSATVTVPRAKLERVLEYLSGEEGHYRQKHTKNHIWLVVRNLSKALETPSPRPFTLVRKPSELLTEQIAAGPCPYCGRLDNWLNDVPMKAYCSGSEEKPHRQWEKVVPRPYNPYLSGYDKKAKPPLPQGIRDLSGTNARPSGMTDAEFMDAALKIVFGGDAINKAYMKEKVIAKIRELSGLALQHQGKDTGPMTAGQWSVQALEDDDGHLNVYITRQGEDIVEIETGQGDGSSGEQLALRFTTPKIEEEYLAST